MASDPILCIGAAHWDLIARAAVPLAPGADVPGSVERRPGGVALNIALALAAHGVAVALRAAVGRDAEGEALIAAATAQGVDCGPCLRAGRTDVYVGIEGPDGELFGAVADCAGLEAAGPALLDRLAADILLDGNLPAACLADPRLAGRAVTLVAASPAKAQRLAPALRGAAALYLNRAEAEAILGTPLPDAAAAAEALRGRGAGLVLVTDGPLPAACAGPSGVVVQAPGSARPASVTGAGDRVVAAHIAARRAGLAPAAALARALGAAVAGAEVAG
jgi:sugar/nucleoside kinase (ribokinase family)